MMSAMPSPTVTEFNHANIPWFAKETNKVQIGRKRSSSDIEADSLPSDPRMWSRSDVRYWVESVCSVHQLPVPEEERFMMNGKAMCLMSAAMFSLRMPLGGKTLYRDFQIRLARALNNCN